MCRNVTKMKYNISINQYAIVANGFDVGTSLETWILMDFLFYFNQAFNHSIYRYENKDYKWIDYNYLIEQNPLANLTNRKIKTNLDILEKLEMIKTIKYQKRVYFILEKNSQKLLDFEPISMQKYTNNDEKNNLLMQKRTNISANLHRIILNNIYIKYKKRKKNIKKEKKDFDKQENLSNKKKLGDSKMLKALRKYKEKKQNEVSPLEAEKENQNKIEQVKQTDIGDKQKQEYFPPASKDLIKIEVSNNNKNQNDSPLNQKLERNDEEVISLPSLTNKNALKSTLEHKNNFEVVTIEKNKDLELFNIFYSHYPRKESKKQAQEVFLKLINGNHKNFKNQKIPVNLIMQKLSLYIKNIIANNQDKKYIKHPATWLNATDFLEQKDDFVTKNKFLSKEANLRIKELLKNLANVMNQKLKENPNLKNMPEYKELKIKIINKCLENIKIICRDDGVDFYFYYGLKWANTIYDGEILNSEDSAYAWYFHKSYTDWLDELNK